MTEEHSHDDSDANTEYEKRLLRKRQSNGLTGFLLDAVFEGCLITIPRLLIGAIAAMLKSFFDD